MLPLCTFSTWAMENCHFELGTTRGPISAWTEIEIVVKNTQWVDNMSDQLFV